MLAFKRSAVILGLVTSILLIPFTAMQFSKEVDWNLTDFLVMGLLLLVGGFAIDFALQKHRSSRRKWAIIAGILMAFLLIWIELAVGIFGSPFAGS